MQKKLFFKLVFVSVLKWLMKIAGSGSESGSGSQMHGFIMLIMTWYRTNSSPGSEYWIWDVGWGGGDPDSADGPRAVQAPRGYRQDRDPGKGSLQRGCRSDHVGLFLTIKNSFVGKFLVGFVRSCKQSCGSGSGKGPYSFELLDSQKWVFSTIWTFLFRKKKNATVPCQQSKLNAQLWILFENVAFWTSGSGLKTFWKCWIRIPTVNNEHWRLKFCLCFIFRCRQANIGRTL